MFGAVRAQDEVPAGPTGPMLVFRTGRSIPLSAVTQQGANFVVSGDVEGYQAGAVIPASSITHVSSEKPQALRTGLGQVLMGQPRDAIKTLEPLLAALKPTARISGNYWIDAARAAVIAYTLEKESSKADALAKEVSEATPEPGIDAIGRLAKALATPISAGTKARIDALSDQVTDSNPVEISAVASYFKGKILQEEKRNQEALKAYLAVGCLYPSGTVLTTSAAELQAALLLSARSERRVEAVALLKSAAAGAPDTVIGTEAKKRFASLSDEKPAAPTPGEKPAESKEKPPEPKPDGN